MLAFDHDARHHTAPHNHRNLDAGDRPPPRRGSARPPLPNDEPAVERAVAELRLGEIHVLVRHPIAVRLAPEQPTSCRRRAGQDRRAEARPDRPARAAAAQHARRALADWARDRPRQAADLRPLACTRSRTPLSVPHHPRRALRPPRMAADDDEVGGSLALPKPARRRRRRHATGADGSSATRARRVALPALPTPWASTHFVGGAALGAVAAARYDGLLRAIASTRQPSRILADAVRARRDHGAIAAEIARGFGAALESPIDTGRCRRRPSSSRSAAASAQRRERRHRPVRERRVAARATRSRSTTTASPTRSRSPLAVAAARRGSRSRAEDRLAGPLQGRVGSAAPASASRRRAMRLLRRRAEPPRPRLALAERARCSPRLATLAATRAPDQHWSVAAEDERAGHRRMRATRSGGGLDGGSPASTRRRHARRRRLRRRRACTSAFGAACPLRPLRPPRSSVRNPPPRPSRRRALVARRGGGGGSPPPSAASAISYASTSISSALAAELRAIYEAPLPPSTDRPTVSAAAPPRAPSTLSAADAWPLRRHRSPWPAPLPEQRRVEVCAAGTATLTASSDRRLLLLAPRGAAVASAADREGRRGAQMDGRASASPRRSQTECPRAAATPPRSRDRSALTDATERRGLSSTGGRSIVPSFSPCRWVAPATSAHRELRAAFESNEAHAALVAGEQLLQQPAHRLAHLLTQAAVRAAATAIDERADVRRHWPAREARSRSMTSRREAAAASTS